jgi:hypothetical protein
MKVSSQPSSESISIEDMEAAMAEIEAGTATAAVQETPVSTKAEQPVKVDTSMVTAPVALPADCGPDSASQQRDPLNRPVPTNPIKEFVNAVQLGEDVRIDPDNLDQACIEHASKFVDYANKRALARRQYEKMKAAFEILESRLYADHRERLALIEETVTDAKGKELTRKVKPTEAQIDAAVKADRRWWGGKQRVIDAQAIYDLAQNAASAFEQRRDMIVQMGSDRRIERQGSLRIMESKASREEAMRALSQRSSN